MLRCAERLAWFAVACLLLLLVHAVALKCEEATKTTEQNTKTIQVLSKKLGVIEKKVDQTTAVDWFLQELQNKKLPKDDANQK